MGNDTGLCDFVSVHCCCSCQPFFGLVRIYEIRRYICLGCCYCRCFRICLGSRCFNHWSRIRKPL